MKYAIIALLSVVVGGVSAARADGFRCAGAGLHATLYNHTQPSEGTKNAAVLIVSSKDQGTIVVVENLSKENGQSTYTVGGVNNAKTDGHFTGAGLEIVKSPNSDGTYQATLILNANGGNQTVPMLCDRYLKSAQ